MTSSFNPTSHIADLIRQAFETDRVIWSRFLTPAEQDAVALLCEKEGMHPSGGEEPGYLFLGGYGDAERKRFFFVPSPDSVLPLATNTGATIRTQLYGNPDCFRYFRITSTTTAQPVPGHRDILGTVLSLGIRRDTIGDILVGEDRNPAWLITSPEVAPLVGQTLTRIGKCRIEVVETPYNGFKPTFRASEQRKGSVASLRLDAILAFAFKTSRTDSADRIRHGDIQVNWLPVVKPDRTLSIGDRISARGLGKAVLLDVVGSTRKNRIFIVVECPSD